MGLFCYKEEMDVSNTDNTANQFETYLHGSGGRSAPDEPGKTPYVWNAYKYLAVDLINDLYSGKTDLHNVEANFRDYLQDYFPDDLSNWDSHVSEAVLNNSPEKA